MYRKISYLVLSLFFSCSLHASEENIDKPKTPIRLRLEDLMEVTPERKMAVEVMLIPYFYELFEKDPGQVFLPLDHPKWHPEELPTEITHKLHYWYFRGMKEEGVAKKYELLYSAACLGHMYAAEEVGHMLLNPDYNDILPVVTTYDHLEPEVKEYDIKRLNEELTENRELAEFLKRVKESEFLEGYYDSDIEDGKGKYDFSNAIVSVKEFIKTIEGLEQTNEVISYKLSLEDTLDQMEKGILPYVGFDFYTPKVKEFLETCKERTYLMKQMLYDRTSSDSEDEGVYEDHVETGFKNYLNHEVLANYACLLNRAIDKQESRDQENVLYIKSEEEIDGEIFQMASKMRTFEVAANFLGGSSFHIHMIKCDSRFYHSHDRALDVFLAHLGFTRFSSPATFDENKLKFMYLLSGQYYDKGVENLERYKKLATHFGLGE